MEMKMTVDGLRRGNVTETSADRKFEGHPVDLTANSDVTFSYDGLNLQTC